MCIAIRKARCWWMIQWVLTLDHDKNRRFSRERPLRVHAWSNKTQGNSPNEWVLWWVSLGFIGSDSNILIVWFQPKMIGACMLPQISTPRKYKSIWNSPIGDDYDQNVNAVGWIPIAVGYPLFFRVTSLPVVSILLAPYQVEQSQPATTTTSDQRWLTMVNL